jgi:hypothetical protein
MKRQFKYWIKERHNPQLGVYYVASGQMSKAAAKRIEDGSLYGSDYMIDFDTKEEYEAKLHELRESGEKVQ